MRIENYVNYVSSIGWLRSKISTINSETLVSKWSTRSVLPSGSSKFIGSFSGLIVSSAWKRSSTLLVYADESSVTEADGSRVGFSLKRLHQGCLTVTLPSRKVNLSISTFTCLYRTLIELLTHAISGSSSSEDGGGRCFRVTIARRICFCLTVPVGTLATLP